MGGAVRAGGVDARPLWPALPQLPPYRECPAGPHPVAREIAATAFWLPTWAGMEPETVAFVARVLGEARGAALAPAAAARPAAAVP
jgi:dTDP-4-amino-4,6-dideoxygalactose transaminase